MNKWRTILFGNLPDAAYYNPDTCTGNKYTAGSPAVVMALGQLPAAQFNTRISEKQIYTGKPLMPSFKVCSASRTTKAPSNSNRAKVSTSSATTLSTQEATSSPMHPYTAKARTKAAKASAVVRAG